MVPPNFLKNILKNAGQPNIIVSTDSERCMHIYL